MALTLAQAQTDLDAARAALRKAVKAQQYSVSDVSITRPRIEQLQREVARLERLVRELTAQAAGADNPGYRLPKFT